jgi:23S rRNA maturation-related 3'-5' exoribonuclease YhaM
MNTNEIMREIQYWIIEIRYYWWFAFLRADVKKTNKHPGTKNAISQTFIFFFALDFTYYVLLS